MKLWVKHGKRNQPFRPHLKIGPTGYHENHWQIQVFKPGVYCGFETYPNVSLAEALHLYLED